MRVIDACDLESVGGGNGFLMGVFGFVKDAVEVTVAGVTAVNAVNTTNVQTYGYDTATSLLAAGNLGA